MSALLATTERRYSAAWLASLPTQKQTKFLNSLPDDEARHLRYDWRFWARDKQLPPDGDWFIWFICAGRGFGKTWTINNWLIEEAQRVGAGMHAAIVGQTKADVRDVLVELGPSSLLKISPPWFMPEYEPSKRRIVWPNGAVATLYSGDEPDQLRGPAHTHAALDELGKYRYPEATWDNLMFGLREGDNPRIAIATTPRPVPIIRELSKDPDAIMVGGSTYENRANLNWRFLERITRYEGTRTGRQEIYGDILGDVAGALWTYKLLDDCRVTMAPPLDAVKIAIDPATTKKRASNLTGIMVAGRLGDGDSSVMYHLSDLSGKYSPDEWARTSLLAWQQHRAMSIIVEDNQGGDMCESTLRMVYKEMVAAGELEARTLEIERVHAKRSKGARAEEASILYRHGRVMHVGTFPDLEDQMCNWIPGQGESPDRVDALVHCLAGLQQAKMFFGF